MTIFFPRPCLSTVIARLTGVLFVITALTMNAETRITVDSSGVTVAGVTAGGEVVIFGRSVTDAGGVPRLERHAFVERDDDGDGTVTHVLEEMPQFSVWVAVDAQTGEFSSTKFGDFPSTTIVLSPQEWRENDDAVDLSRAYLDFLLVRPGKGAWMLKVLQGGERDGDGRVDDNLRLRTADMQPLWGKESAPPHAVKKDVLVVIDPHRLDLAVVAAE
jgi:hypothetical protein